MVPTHSDFLNERAMESHKGYAPPARRGRRVRVPRAFKRPVKNLVVVVVVVRTPTPNYLRQASPDWGKYLPY